MFACETWCLHKFSVSLVLPPRQYVVVRRGRQRARLLHSELDGRADCKQLAVCREDRYQRVITVLTVIILLLWRRDGDVILINKRCTSLPPVQALLCFASKYGLSGDGRHGWDHAAIVYREPKTNVPMLLEGGPGGVSLRTFEERLMQGTDHQEVLLLPLRGADGQAQSDKNQKLENFVKVHGTSTTW